MVLKVCFATRNKNKIKEIEDLIPPEVELLSLDDINCKEELPETTRTIEGNSKQKAKYVWDNYQINCFADDSGLEVEALNGEPGVDSAYYGGEERNHDKNIEKLLKNLKDKNERKAQFKTVITLFLNGESHQFTGIIKGEILEEKRGKGGFGYDPIFIPENEKFTFAEMPLSQKNTISHRSRALKQLIDFLQAV